MTPTHIHAPPAARIAGFTLLELMITVTVAAILLGIGVPTFADIIRNNRLTTAANDLLHSTQRARSEAVKRQAQVVVCASADASAMPPACNDGAFTQWIVFADTDGDWVVDANEPILERHTAVHPSLTVLNDFDGIISYAGTGFATPAPPAGKEPTRNVVICDRRGNRQIGEYSTARALLIQATGRTRVTKDYDDLETVINAVGACPQ